MLFLLFFAFFAQILAAAPKYEYEIHVAGSLKCGQYPAASVLVRLWKDNERTILNQTFADKSGHFGLSAQLSTANFDPIIVIFHDCDDGVKPGQRKLKFQIPRHYIAHVSAPRKIFELGQFNLETVMKYNEERQQSLERRRHRRHMHKSARSQNLERMAREGENQTTREHLRRHRARRSDDFEIVETDDVTTKKHHHKSTTKKPTTVKKTLFDSEPDDRYDPW
ncbi:unnamed protein product [Caenorhabditis angaria]|uniref:Transthyretin-like family protein n=1 Tax=Caenorhabditis angaria TaxID=860376 RepID=A0A9P1N6P8_9PELO|nr:unnamed protein product [Caenorhabditis angaria]